VKGGAIRYLPVVVVVGVLIAWTAEHVVLSACSNCERPMSQGSVCAAIDSFDLVCHRAPWAHSKLHGHLSAKLPTSRILTKESLQDVRNLVDVDVPPCWLHGDLTPANILVREVAGESRVSLIDFGDSGHGDPLFDLVPLHLITFRSAPNLVAACTSTSLTPHGLYRLPIIPTMPV